MMEVISGLPEFSVFVFCSGITKVGGYLSTSPLIREDTECQRNASSLCFLLDRTRKCLHRGLQ